jgi:hypothetical protein
VELDLGLREQCAALVERSGSTQPFGTYILAANDPAAELGRIVEREVFGEFFANTPEMLTEEYAPYEPSSVFLCVIDQRRLVPAGVSRVIRPSTAGFKSVDDIERVWEQQPDDVIARTGSDLDLRQCWDVATLATTADYRGAASEGLVSLALYQAIIMSALAADVPWLVAVMDVAVIDLLSERIGSPFSRYPEIEPRRYLDSPASLPVYVDLIAYGLRLAAADEAIHSILFRGIGLEAALWTADWRDATRNALVQLDAAAQADSVSTARGAGRS